MSAGISLRVDCPAQLLVMERTAYAVPSSRSTQGNLLKTQRRSSEALQWLSPDVTIKSKSLTVACKALHCLQVLSTLQTHWLPAAHSLCSPHASLCLLYLPSLFQPWDLYTHRFQHCPWLAPSHAVSPAQMSSHASLCSHLYLPSHCLIYVL